MLEIAFQASNASFGYENGGCSQFKFVLVKLISLSPNGAPWTLLVPWKFGEPNPIFVLHAIKLGYLLFLARLIVFSISSKLWPSTAKTSQPLDLNLSIWFTYFIIFIFI